MQQYCCNSTIATVLSPARLPIGRAGARPLDGGDYHSGGRPPVRPTAAIITRAGARPPARRRRLSLGRLSYSRLPLGRAPARPPDGGDYHLDGCLTRDSRASVVSLEIPGIVVSLEIPVFPIFLVKNSRKIVTIGFSDSRDQNEILKFLRFFICPVFPI